MKDTITIKSELNLSFYTLKFVQNIICIFFIRIFYIGNKGNDGKKKIVFNNKKNNVFFKVAD